jgi:hypothetical protein
MMAESWRGAESGEKVTERRRKVDDMVAGSGGRRRKKAEEGGRRRKKAEEGGRRGWRRRGQVDEWLWKEEEDEVMGGETNKPSGGDRKACL